MEERLAGQLDVLWLRADEVRGLASVVATSTHPIVTVQVLNNELHATAIESLKDLGVPRWRPATRMPGE